MDSQRRERRGSFRIKLCEWLAAAIILTQLGLMARARFFPERFFCWAPHDQQTEYRISATLDGEPIDPWGILRRYAFKSTGVDPRATANLLRNVRVYRQRYGRDELSATQGPFSLRKNCQKNCQKSCL